MSELLLQRHLEQLCLSPTERQQRLREVHRRTLAESCALDAANFSQFHPSDLRRMFDLYDELFLEGSCREHLGETPLSFRISSRMTSAGGKTTRFVHRRQGNRRSYEITVASTLLFQTFRDVRRTVTVTGLECRNRLEALQRIMEHELVHLMEMLLWEDSSCSAARFQSIAARLFGHTDHRHALVTPRERASREFGLQPGSRVSFLFEGREYVGFVNRITKRATVLVEDRGGQRFSDGRYYSRFYIPVEMLRPAPKHP